MYLDEQGKIIHELSVQRRRPFSMSLLCNTCLGHVRNSVVTGEIILEWLHHK